MYSLIFLPINHLPWGEVVSMVSRKAENGRNCLVLFLRFRFQKTIDKSGWISGVLPKGAETDAGLPEEMPALLPTRFVLH